ncbi:hypothetical protein N8645_00465 [bacterium]|nr:hypothetical protein [bacterium]
MQNGAERKLSNLLKNSSVEKEVLFNVGNDILRLNLKPDDIRLWKETLNNIPDPGNILLACESDQVELKTTKLTWIVGAAIRSTKVETTSEVIKLLSSLDIPNEIAEAVCKYCPGLGSEIAWAFYLERHGWLTASPIIDIKQLGKS